MTLRNDTFSIPLWELLSAIFVSIVVYKILSNIFKKILSLFSSKPNPKKGIGYLQQAFSGMLMKDHKLVLKTLSKAKRHLGDIPIISWLEGQLYLIDGDNYNARSKFFYLSAKEKDTALGAYSLAQLSLQNKSDEDAIEAIKSILRVYPNAQNFLQKIISLCIKNGKSDEAFEYFNKLESSNKKDIEAVIYYEKWRNYGQIDDLKKASKLALNIPNIVIDYADELCKNNEKKSAQKVLRKSFGKFPSRDVFRKYIEIFAEETSEKIKKAEKLRKVAPQSWIPYYYLAKFSEEEGIYTIALSYIRRAYDLRQYDFIANEFIKINTLLNSDGTPGNPIESKKVEFFWRCAECGNLDANWRSICPHCLATASYSYFEEIQETLPVG